MVGIADSTLSPGIFERVFILADRINARGPWSGRESHNALLDGADARFIMRRIDDQKRRRRRPGEAWDLWLVIGKDRMTQLPKALGYLVSDGRRFPKPIAFIYGVGRSLRLALDVRGDHRQAARLERSECGRDLRGKSWRDRSKRRLLGMLLRPVDTLGRFITSDGTFAAGMYAMEPRYARKSPGSCQLVASGALRPAFRLMTAAGLQAIDKPQKENEPQTIKPIAPQVSSKLSNEALKVAAA